MSERLTLKQAQRIGDLVAAKGALAEWIDTVEDDDYREFDWVVLDFKFEDRKDRSQGFTDAGVKLPPDLARAAITAMMEMVDRELVALGVNPEEQQSEAGDA